MGMGRSSAKQNNALCFFFWKKKTPILFYGSFLSIKLQIIVLGMYHIGPLINIGESGAQCGGVRGNIVFLIASQIKISSKQNNGLCFFSGKRKKPVQSWFPILVAV
jgi:hypothetical protein